MPFPNFHSARISQPGLFQRIVQIDEAERGAIRFIGGPLKSDPSDGAEIQAVRFDEDKYTPEQARAWLKEHDFKPISFESATKGDSADADAEVWRFDNLALGKLERQSDGTLLGEAVVTRSGVFAYRTDNGGTVHEFRPPDEVFHTDSLSTAQLIPITIEHPRQGRVTPDNAKKLSVGTTGESVRQDGSLVRAPIRITARDGIDAIENGGKRQLSLGYRASVERCDGEHKGQCYTHVQRQIRYNHLALTVKARAGDVASVRLDAGDAVQVDDAGGGAPPAPAGRSGPMPVQLRIDSGLDYEVPAEVEAAWKVREGKVSELQTKLDSVTAERDAKKTEAETATAQRDEAQAKVKELEKVDNADAIKSGVKARLSVESAAHRAKLEKETLEKLDSMSDDEIRMAVIKSRHKDFNAEGKSPDYISARFDAVVEGLANEQDPGPKVVGDRSGTHTDATVEEAREKSIAAQKSKSRGEKASA